MAKTHPKRKSRLRRKKHIRKNVVGTTEKPRLSIFRSAKHMYAQIIDDTTGSTLASASTLTKQFEDNNGGNKDAAKKSWNFDSESCKREGNCFCCF
jgi:large subunit ribosomal protein L18